MLWSKVFGGPQSPRLSRRNTPAWWRWLLIQRGRRRSTHSGQVTFPIHAWRVRHGLARCSPVPAIGHFLVAHALGLDCLCQLTMLARLFVYKAISCPGSLGECEFAGNFSLGRLHCLGDRVASLRKSVSSYFGCCFGRESPPAIRLSHCRVVGIHFLALSKPGQPHQKRPE